LVCFAMKKGGSFGASFDLNLLLDYFNRLKMD
jgi:hypothetical protein